VISGSLAVTSFAARLFVVARRRGI
jgi:hypothetical protein